MKVYDCEEYGGKLFYFNRILRSSSYKPLIKKPAIEESSILEVEPEVVSANEETNNDNNNDAKKVSFDSSSTPESSESSNTTKKITL